MCAWDAAVGQAWRKRRGRQPVSLPLPACLFAKASLSCCHSKRLFHVHVWLTTGAGVQASPALAQELSRRGRGRSPGGLTTPRSSQSPLAESPGRAERAWHPTEIRCAPAPAETHADTLRTGTAGPVPCRKEAGRMSERAGRFITAVCSRCGARLLVRGGWCAVRGACADAAGCQPSAGGGVGERRQKPRAGQCLVCCVL